MIVVFFSGFEMYQISVCRGLMLGFAIKGDINVIAQQLLPSLHTERSETQKSVTIQTTNMHVAFITQSLSITLLGYIVLLLYVYVNV